MNFQSIQYFLQVARRRSFSQAAEELFITQQTLSASIASLEKELGCKLFVRHIPLELTYGGELFLQYARAFFTSFIPSPKRSSRSLSETASTISSS